MTTTWDNGAMPLFSAPQNLPEAPENVPQAKSGTDVIDATTSSI